MLGLPLAFATPFVLSALLLLPVIWWLLRLMPPRPQSQAFPPTRLLAEITKKEDTPNTSPWWLTALRLALAALVIFALAGPSWQPNSNTQTGDNPLVLIVDNGWTSSDDWSARLQTGQAIVEEAALSGRPVALAMTTDPENVDIRLEDPDDVLERLSAQRPQPFVEDRGLTAQRIEAVKDTLEDADVIWLASPIKTTGDENLANAVSGLGNINVRFDDVPRIAIADMKNDASAMNVTVKRIPEGTPPLVLTALDGDGIALAEVPVSPSGNSTELTIPIELPIELRNEIVRLSLTNESGIALESAGGTYLVDDRSRRRTVGLLSGVSADRAQPLLSPLYYINRALEPFADIREAQTPNLTEAVPNLLRSGVSMIVMADVGTLPTSENERLREFMENGGTVLRFAGPRLAAAEDTLTPVRLREGERNLGGSLTWEEPQKLARFSENGPFAGMNLPDDIEIRRQVLAEPDFDLLQKTWAELEDGTPLVTAEQVGNGWLVLFHVTADATWSNLPISGAFVDMLVKLVAFSSVPANAVASENPSEAAVFPPFQTLDALGRLGPPFERAEPIAIEEIDTVEASQLHPPGFYGRSESLIAHNLMNADTPLEPLEADTLLADATVTPLGDDVATDLRPAFFTMAMMFLLIDALVVAAMAGLLATNPITRIARHSAKAATIIIAAALFLSIPEPTTAQEQGADIPFDATFTTRLAYVVTGNASVDDVSASGLKGLTNFLSLRTALEPGPPVGIDITKDELAFYALLYWPVSADATVPDAATMARVDAFMKQGGTVLFDTKDQIDVTSSGLTQANAKLRQIVASLDVPPLEPVPANHVLTRAFYLLQDFPGRWIGSPLWVEASEGNGNVSEETRSQADGVSSILITANDFAGAWAVDENLRPLLPTVPNDPNQRVYAFRTGVNIVMYTLTGNYKADQVHIPALLERLGQ